MARDKEKSEVTEETTPSDRDDAAERIEVEVKGSDDESSEDATSEPESELTEEEKLAARVAELDDRLLRTVAEFDNFKKRTARRFEEIVRTANDQLMLELLDVVDNFERALDQSDGQKSDKAYREGMKLIYDQLTALLSRYEVSPIEAVGKPFDPHLHDAVLQVESDEHPEGTVALELAKGYRQGERVLRHSKVGVAKPPSSGNESADRDD